MTDKELRDQIVALVVQWDREHGDDKQEECPKTKLIDALACGLAIYSGIYSIPIRPSLDEFEHFFKIRYKQVQDRDPFLK